MLSQILLLWLKGIEARFEDCCFVRGLQSPLLPHTERRGEGGQFPPPLQTTYQLFIMQTSDCTIFVSSYAFLFARSCRSWGIKGAFLIDIESTGNNLKRMTP
jgi:hypothetical protein